MDRKLINQVLTLKLNKNWLPIGNSPVEKLMVDMYTGVVCPLAVDYELFENGEPDFESPNSMTVVKDWDEWAKLPVREWEFAIHTRTSSIRIPFIVICSVYDQIPNKQVMFPTKSNIWDRDDAKCQYTDLSLDKAQRSVDHIIPSAKNGQNEWSNLVTCHKELNSWKSDMVLGECFLTEAPVFSDPALESWKRNQISTGKTALQLLRKPSLPKHRSGTVVQKTRREWNNFVF